MLNAVELADLEELLTVEFNDNLTGILTKLNRKGLVKEWLEMMGLNKLLKGDVEYQPYKTGKIVVIGGCDIKEKVLNGVASSLGFDKSRFEWCLDYDQAKKFDYKKMQYKPSYSLVLFGPVPHSGHEKGEYASVISAIENTPGYPPVIRMGSNSLKITKSSFKEALMNARKIGYVN